MIQNILIPTDGSDYGKTAIAYGVYFARKAERTTDRASCRGYPPHPGSRLHGYLRLYRPPPVSGVPAGHRERPRRQSRRDPPGFPRAVRGGGGASRNEESHRGDRRNDHRRGTQVLRLDPLGPAGEHFHINGGAILGSTAQSVVRRSGKPVLVTPEHFREIKSMAIAYDGSAPAHKALKLAAELSKQAAWPLSVVMVTADRTSGENISKKAGGTPVRLRDGQRRDDSHGQGR